MPSDIKEEVEKIISENEAKLINRRVYDPLQFKVKNGVLKELYDAFLNSDIYINYVREFEAEHEKPEPPRPKPEQFRTPLNYTNRTPQKEKMSTKINNDFLNRDPNVPIIPKA